MHHGKESLENHIFLRRKLIRLNAPLFSLLIVLWSCLRNPDLLVSCIGTHAVHSASHCFTDNTETQYCGNKSRDELHKPINMDVNNTGLKTLNKKQLCKYLTHNYTHGE